MESRYNEADARQIVRDIAERAPPDLALRTYTARLLGADPALVLHGGGNTSVKTRGVTLLGEAIDVIHVKGSGWDLATIEPAGHPAVRLAELRALRPLPSLSDEAMVNQLRLNLLDAAAPTPSVETLLHAYLPAKFIDHTHADAVLAIADQPDAERVCRLVYGDGLVWVPYVMPGFALAQRCAEAFEATANPSVIVLERHGIFTFGDTAQQSYERMIDAVTRAERFVSDRRRTHSSSGSERVRPRVEEVLPRLRGALARAMKFLPERGPILSLDASNEALFFLQRRDAFELSQRGCATPDHVLRTKPVALFLRDPAYDDEARFGAQLESEIAAYGARYDAYFAEMCAAKGVAKKKLDPWPRVILLPGLGACSVGRTASEARIAGDIYAHTMTVMSNAADVGEYAPLGRADLFDMEYWSLEQAKLKPLAEAPLSGRVALVSGAASGIGRAIATRFLALGAHVMLADCDRDALVAAEGELRAKYASQVAHVVCDVVQRDDVARAIASTVATFGGIDLLVSNAGNAPQGRLDADEGDASLRASLELNLLAHNALAGGVSRVMIAQGTGGALLFNASKSAFNPGPAFGPYAVAKAALVALMRQYAVDLGSFGVRANAVNADRVRTALFGGGVVESRAAARGLSVDDYFRANLLKREVFADDVAGACGYLATAAATTGCVVTVDGGNASAFPR